MILLDPEIDPDLEPDATRRARATASHSAEPRKMRIPTRATLSRFLTQAKAALRLRGQVTVLLTTDRNLRRLNRQFRGLDKATDVLSFPAGGVGAEAMAGELAIGVPTARRQAAAQGHTLTCELKILILHGLLHLAGYDHETDTGRMARRERQLRARLRLPLSLIERATVPGKARPPVPQVSILRPGKAKTPTRRSRRP